MSRTARVFGWLYASSAFALAFLFSAYLYAAEPRFKDSGWPFLPLQSAPVPQFENQSWIRNPIDAFVLDKLQASELKPNVAADRLTLLRRLSYDLLGVPPTLEMQERFLKDRRPDAYERLVETYLASPEYGERWAQHWLDVVRYAESAGFKSDQVRPAAHQYRDYVIRALNSDISYSRFISQQLAGDELEPENPDALIATGMNRLYPEETQASNFKQARQDILDEVTEVTGFAFMGLTMGCAKCHDHKFDEIKQTDFYRLQAFFTPMLPRDDLAAVSRSEQRAYAKQFSEWEQATQSLRAEMDALCKETAAKLREEALGPLDKETQLALATPTEQRTCMQKQLAAFAKYEIDRKVARAPGRLEGETKARYDALANELAKFDHLKPAPLPLVMALSDGDDEAPTAYLFETGNYQKPLFEVQPGFPEFLDEQTPEIVRPEGRPESTGRRSALAKWLTRPEHPLTARVMVNRIWQHHFGEGLVGTPNDFGVMGESTEHKALLDWLADQFVQHDWQLKPLHRLIVLSNTYRQSSLVRAEDPIHQKALAEDPQNQLLWRYTRQRLDGEMIRDTMLHVSGQMNRRMFGPSAKPSMPEPLRESRYAWTEDEELADQQRRSIYVLAKRNLRYPFFTAFDAPDAISSCPERMPTTTAPQALALLNSELSLELSRHWAGQLLRAYPHDIKSLVETAYRSAYGRPPSEDERREAIGFLVQQAEAIVYTSEELTKESLPEPTPWNSKLKVAELTAVVDFCHALLNSTELVYLE